MTATSSNPQPQPQNFHVVGVGASAGGLEAFKKFLRAVPKDSGMAYVLVQHLSPKHESVLAELLASQTELPVHVIADEMNLAPNHVYIIPENKILTAENSTLKLSPRGNAPRPYLPIDIFFSSLAETHKSFAIGVVLSGTGFDGTLGLKSIREFGGATIAQEPSTAAFETMPYNAIAANAVDYVLPPEEIPLQLQHISRAYKSSFSHQEDVPLPVSDEEVFNHILLVLNQSTGHDFSKYKQATIRRRIARRMVLSKRIEPAAYLAHLKGDKTEQVALFNDILIPVTYFFRDPKVFDSLVEQVLPHLENVRTSNTLRIWCAGCSTGEEVYSLAMALHEYFGEDFPKMKIQIFATDISENVVAKARAGSYQKQDLENVSEARIAKYFTKSAGIYTINKFLRDICVFAVHNFLKDPPFARIDLITCRNVLIYFSQSLQAKALQTFHYSLKDNGLLLLGKSETVSAAPGLFQSFVKGDKIYIRKVAASDKKASNLNRTRNTMGENAPAMQRSVLEKPDIQKSANDIIFKRFTPSGAVVNENFDIVHFHGDTSLYLQSLPGKPNFNILKMAREGLAFELQSALLSAKKEMQPATKKNLSVKSGNDLLNVDLEVVPIPNVDEAHFLVLFAEPRPIVTHTTEGRHSADVQRISQLEAELIQLRSDIKTITDEQQAAIEALQSANEELLTTSEELQSLNEELETSTEELQANNEELMSVNDELMDRQEQLAEARLYADAIISTVGESFIVLDKDLRIRTVNAAFHKQFGTNDGFVEGKLFYEILDGIWKNPKLRILLEDVLPKQSWFEGFEVELETEHGVQTLILNGRQLIREKFGEALILITIDDVTDSKLYSSQRKFAALLEKQVKERTEELATSRTFLHQILNASNYGIASYEPIYDHDGHVTDFRVKYTNSEVPRLFGLTAEKVTGKTCSEVYPGIFKNGVFEKMKTCMELGLDQTYDVEVNINGSDVWLTANVSRVNDTVTVTSKNITTEKNTALHLQAINKLLANKNRELEHQILSDFSESLSSYKTGQDFFNLLLLELYQKTKMDYIIMGEAVQTDSGETMQCIAVAAHGKIVENFSYPLQGTACRDIVHGKSKSRTIASNLQKTYPDNKILNRYDIDSYSGVALLDGAGKCIGVMAVMHHSPIRDVAYVESLLGIAAKRCEMELERQRNQKILEEKNAELERNNKELEAFNYIASHDLQEPLRKIQLFQSRILERERNNLSPASIEYFQTVTNAADRMQKLIEALLSYSTANLSASEFVRTDMNKVLAEVKDDLEDVISERGATIESGPLPVIHAIPVQIRQLLLNLITNGIKYSKKDEPPHIRITATKTSPEEFGNIKYHKITVLDNGIGFEQKYEHKIFELFQRLHGKTDFVGTGIGLAICKKIAQNHKGFIKATSEPGKGAEFTIFLPV